MASPFIFLINLLTLGIYALKTLLPSFWGYEQSATQRYIEKITLHENQVLHIYLIDNFINGLSSVRVVVLKKQSILKKQKS